MSTQKNIEDHHLSLEQALEQLEQLKKENLQKEKIITALKKSIQRKKTLKTEHASIYFAAASLEEKIKERTADLEHSNAQLRAALNKEREAARLRDKALDASKTKSRFLANMSHEIRTPMNGVIGMASLLIGTKLTDEQRDYVNIIQTSGESLLGIINDILDFSKIEAGKLELEVHPFDVRSCIGEAIDLVSPLAAKKRLELLLRIHERVPRIVKSDITRLRQILVNLLSNAIKFTEKGEIVVSVAAEILEHDVYSIDLSVMDTGIGIPEDRLDSLFDAFSQVDTSTTRKYGGTGLGLSISAQLAKMLGGGLTVSSEIGVGSTFQVTIVAPIEQSSVQYDCTSLDSKRVLIVEDNETNRKILTDQLRAWNMDPLAVSSGAEAIRLINDRNRFDVAILDCQMPEIDGSTLAKKLKNHKLSGDVSLIMLSCIGDRQIYSGEFIDRWLTKPAKPDQLHQSLASLFGAERIAENNTPVTADDLKAIFGLTRILLVDDNLINQKVALKMLEHLGGSADTAANGEEAVFAMTQAEYDIILMDMMMPVMSGIEATQKIRANKRIQQPVIIALTANAMEEDRKKCMEAGMDDFLPKPIKKDILKGVLSKWIVR